MSITEIKEKLHQIIDSSDDEQLLEQIIRVMQLEQGTKHTLDALTPKQRERIERSWEQSNYPEQCTPHSQVKEEAARWSEKKP